MSYDPYIESTRCCRRCGAELDSWYCDACGGSCLDAITNAYVTEPAEPMLEDVAPIIEFDRARIAA